MSLFFQQLNSVSKWSVLFIVYYNPGLSGRKISYLSGMGWVPVRNSLEDLCRRNFLIRKKKGRAYTYYPNKHHILYPLLKEFFQRLDRVHEILFEDLRRELFGPHEEELLALKLTPSTLYLITRSRADHLLSGVRKHLHQRGLDFLRLEILSFEELTTEEKRCEIKRLPGRSCGIPLFQLMDLL
ncbi:hypothetical protein [Thermosulfurimonas sp. F29]|uniref:hypothetical protein n=1 Tax=Thermosulfurimonas sp. F29 TaxID=2867247 RepID=UPI001C830BA6|nr:hypothetical protein [Thermosulfurimonas sp. F29]MBX6423582.1 hypothetical protein [Thermosulfurimonas sp. F29]